MNGYISIQKEIIYALIFIRMESYSQQPVKILFRKENVETVVILVMSGLRELVSMIKFLAVLMRWSNIICV